VAPGTAASFHHADLLSYARDATADYDVILMSFSLHHLATEAKGQVLQEAHRLLVRNLLLHAGSSIG